MRKLFCVLALLLCSCRLDRDDPVNALRGLGLQHIELGESVTWSCPRSARGRLFSAQDSAGRGITGIVCCYALRAQCWVTPSSTLR